VGRVLDYQNRGPVIRFLPTRPRRRAFHHQWTPLAVPEDHGDALGVGTGWRAQPAL